MRRLWLILWFLMAIMVGGSFGHWAASLWLPGVRAEHDGRTLDQKYEEIQRDLERSLNQPRTPPPRWDRLPWERPSVTCRTTSRGEVQCTED